MYEDRSALPHLAAGIPAAEGDLLLARRARLVRPHIPAGQQVMLDFGCGNGAQTFGFVDYFQRIIGLDIDPTFLAAFQAHAADRGMSDRAHPVRYGGTELPLASASVDCVVSFAVLEHVVDEALALQEIARIIRPGGILLMSVPNRWWIFETHGANLPLLPWNRVPFVSWWPRKWHDRFARARIYEKREFEAKITHVGFELIASQYLTAPMDVVKWRPLQSALRRTLFRSDSIRIPVLATEVVVAARRLPTST